MFGFQERCGTLLVASPLLLQNFLLLHCEMLWWVYNPSRSKAEIPTTLMSEGREVPPFRTRSILPESRQKQNGLAPSALNWESWRAPYSFSVLWLPLSHFSHETDKDRSHRQQALVRRLFDSKIVHPFSARDLLPNPWGPSQDLFSYWIRNHIFYRIRDGYLPNESKLQRT